MLCRTPRFPNNHHDPFISSWRRRLAGSVGILCLLALVPRSAQADPFVTIDVPAHGGAYMVDVHADVLSVFHFPAEIQVAYSVQQPPTMVIEKHARSITVQPLPGTKYGSVNVQCGAFTVGLLLRVVDRPEDAAVQVNFRPLEFEREIARRTELEFARQWNEAQDELARERAALQRERTKLAEKGARLQALVREAAMQQVADEIRVRHRTVTMSGLSRQEYVQLRIERVVWLGPNAFVFFSIENRRATPYRLGRAVLRVGGMERFDALSFPQVEGADTHGMVGIVPPGARYTGVIALRDAANWLGERIALHVIEDRNQEAALGSALTLPFFLRE